MPCCTGVGVLEAGFVVVGTVEVLNVEEAGAVNPIVRMQTL